MADYKIAPDSTGIISLGAMRKSLVAEADYAASSKHTAASTSVNTLVGSPSTYQTNCDSFTWSATSPKGFQEMYGETWSDGAGGVTTHTFTLNVTNNNNNCDKSTVTIKVNGTTVATMTSTAGSAPTWNVSSFQATTAQSVAITAQSQGGGGAGCNTFDTQVIVYKDSTLLLDVNSGNSATHTFTPSANQIISVNSFATM